MNYDLTRDVLVLREGGGTDSTDSINFRWDKLGFYLDYLKQMLKDESISETCFKREFVLVVESPATDVAGTFPVKGKIVHKSKLNLNTAYFWGVDEDFGVRIYSQRNNKFFKYN